MWIRLLKLFNIAAWLRWWGQGLLLWLPESLQRLFVSTPGKQVIALQHEHIVVLQEKGRIQKELARYSRSSLADGTLQLPKVKAKNSLSVLRLDDSQVLAKSTTLPAAAEANLRQVLGFEIDRLTPFASDKIFYDAEIIARRPENRTLQVRFIVVLRSVLEDLLKQLKAVGIRPDIVDTHSSHQAINLLPIDSRPQRGRLAQSLQWLLLLLVMMALLAAAALPLWQQRSVAITLQPEVDKMQNQAESVVALRNQVETAIESSRFLVQKRSANARVIEIVNELTLVLPDHTWVEQLIVKNKEVQVRGQSQDAASLIGIVEASDYFEQVSFRSPVTRDTRTQRDRFFLSAQVTNPLPLAIADVELESPNEVQEQDAL